MKRLEDGGLVESSIPAIVKPTEMRTRSEDEMEGLIVYEVVRSVRNLSPADFLGRKFARVGKGFVVLGS